jgi:long-subunit acyl-CoA synthetase (AMP-forming)
MFQGVFVAPEQVEAVLRQSAFVRQVFVHGSGFMANVAAAVVPSPLLLQTVLGPRPNGDSHLRY